MFLRFKENNKVRIKTTPTCKFQTQVGYEKTAQHKTKNIHTNAGSNGCLFLSKVLDFFFVKARETELVITRIGNKQGLLDTPRCECPYL